MDAKKYLTENSDWFDKSPGGEKLYFESEVIKMMNDYANEFLRINSVLAGSKQLMAFSKWYEDNYKFQISDTAIEEYQRKIISS